MSDLLHPWLNWCPAVDACEHCRTDAAHALAYREAEAEWQQAMDPRISMGRPGSELRNRRADLQLAVVRRQECRAGHGDQ